MTTDDRFGRTLAAWLEEDADTRVPAHLVEVLVQTAATRQRPWWSSPERWLPVDIATQAVPTSAPRIGRLIVVALIVLVLASATILLVGATRPRVPAPFGPARNGLLAYFSDGDIYLANADGAAPHAVVTGPTNDFAPWFSHDGTRFAFWREVDSHRSDLMVANADGTGVRGLLVTPLVDADWFEWSPGDDRLAVVHTVGGVRALTVVKVDGDPAPRRLDLGGLSVDNDVYWLPPDGSELVFTARTDPTSAPPGIYSIRPDGTWLRTLAPVANDFYHDLAVSPAGGRLAFSDVEADTSDNLVGWHLHLVDIDNGNDRQVTYGAPAPNVDEHGPVFSPDGSHVLLWRELGNSGDLLLAEVNAPGSGIDIGPLFPNGTVEGYGFAPDGRTVFLLVRDEPARLIDTVTGNVTTLDLGIENPTSWQRLVP
jgi:hypothetical protein